MSENIQIILTRQLGEDPYNLVTLRIRDQDIFAAGGYVDAYTAMKELALWLAKSWDEEREASLKRLEHDETAPHRDCQCLVCRLLRRDEEHEGTRR